LAKSKQNKRDRETISSSDESPEKERKDDNNLPIQFEDFLNFSPRRRDSLIDPKQEKEISEKEFSLDENKKIVEPSKMVLIKKGEDYSHSSTYLKMKNATTIQDIMNIQIPPTHLIKDLRLSKLDFHSDSGLQIDELLGIYNENKDSQEKK